MRSTIDFYLRVVLEIYKATLKFIAKNMFTLVDKHKEEKNMGITYETRIKINDLYNEGHTVSEIAKILDLSEAIVSNILFRSCE